MSDLPPARREELRESALAKLTAMVRASDDHGNDSRDWPETRAALVTAIAALQSPAPEPRSVGVEGLLPCPFCGAEAVRNGRTGVGGVRCNAGVHFAQAYGETQAVADANWNARALSPAQRDEDTRRETAG